jgi:Na+-transporting methylmalonyl-CoA/oxaloacetate decarboxylase beta subunit
MESALVSGLQGIFLGITNLGLGHVIMILVGSLLLYLGISKVMNPVASAHRFWRHFGQHTTGGDDG